MPGGMPSVAVIGLGAFGLVTLKNLVEEGFDATGFEKNPYVGGLWHYTAESTTSALQSTIVNVSSQRCCFTDFPFKDGTGSYPTAAEVDKYLNEYADHFQLRPKCKMGTAVTSLEESTNGWLVKTCTTSGTKAEQFFDKVVCANGVQHVPIIPELPRSSLFKGKILHSTQFKHPADFRDKSVLVVGMGNSAADSCTSLVGIAKTVYLAHRAGCLFLPRFMKDGSCFDHGANYRMFIIRDVLEILAPQLAGKFVDNFLQTTQNKEYRLRPEWNLTPIPSIQHKLPVVSDSLISELESGRILSVPAPEEVLGDRQVKLTDGQVVEVDAIILCTGHRRDYSFLGPNDPSIVPPNGTHSKQEHNYDTPRLYQNVLSLEHPDSLAFVGTAITYFAAFLGAELSAMAIAQLWKDPSQLPSQIEMEDWYESHLLWASNIRKTGNFIPNMTQFWPWMRWIEEVTDTRVDEHLTYFSPTAWKFWWQDRALCGLLLDGIYSPHVFRLFPSRKRKTWPGAREAIERVNREAREQKVKRASALKEKPRAS